MREFLDLRQTKDSMMDITTRFRERALLIRQHAADEEMKKTQFHNMLKDGIREFVSFSVCRTLEEMIDRARE